MSIWLIYAWCGAMCYYAVSNQGGAGRKTFISVLSKQSIEKVSFVRK